MASDNFKSMFSGEGPEHYVLVPTGSELRRSLHCSLTGKLGMASACVGDTRGCNSTQTRRALKKERVRSVLSLPGSHCSGQEQHLDRVHMDACVSIFN